jgi:hypothetical protein
MDRPLGAEVEGLAVDQHLRGRPQARLDQPSSRCPEVTFCSS